MTSIITKFKLALQQELPAAAAHKLMLPECRSLDVSTKNAQSAGVLIILFLVKAEWHFTLIQRTIGNYPHSGEICFPGGGVENGESVRQAALRETFEEVGLEPSTVQILGKLSSIPTMVSNYVVTPFVGIVEYQPKWKINQREVKFCFSVGLPDLLDPTNIATEIWDLPFGKRLIPYFNFGGHKVWGVTAMILSEFKEILVRKNLS